MTRPPPAPSSSVGLPTIRPDYRHASRRITILLRTDFRQVIGSLRFRHLVYTGAIDEYYDFSEGALGYRSLRFEHEPVDQEYFQPGMQVNYPNDHDFTRIVEIKHATGHRLPVTTIVREYPADFGPGKEPSYPIPAPASRALYPRDPAPAPPATGPPSPTRPPTHPHANQ